MRPGNFVFPDASVGEVWPTAARPGAEGALRGAMAFGDGRSVEQDLECAVRQLVEAALWALPSSPDDPFTAIVVLGRFGAALCFLAGRELADGRA